MARPQMAQPQQTPMPMSRPPQAPQQDQGSVIQKMLGLFSGKLDTTPTSKAEQEQRFLDTLRNAG
jgi:hypothetical protein